MPKISGRRPGTISTPKPPPARPPKPAAIPTTGGPRDAGAAWATFLDSRGGVVTGARIQGLSSPMMNGAGRVVFPWDKPGDTIPFELTVEVNGDRSKVRPEL
ncbi:MAG: hypothetical protein ACYC8T_37880, partial [Myxococcaceae bacterium]